MNITRVRTLRGPNVWSRRPAIEVTVQCDSSRLCETHNALLQGIVQELTEKTSSGGPTQRSDGGDQAPAGTSDSTLGTAIAGEVARIALALQNSAGCGVDYCAVKATRQQDEYCIVVQYADEHIGRLALEQALEICESVLQGGQVNWQEAVSQVQDAACETGLGPSTASIVQAAVQRGIPYRRLTSGSLVQFGWGTRQRRILAAETDSTSAVAEQIAQDKVLTKALLAAGGVKVPEGRCVADLEGALRAAAEIDGPVVVKPRDGNQGKGVTVNLQGRDEIAGAFERAAAHCDHVIVERYFPGDDFRLLVVQDRLVAAARRDPPSVMGDGRRSVAQLIDRVNEDPRRGQGHECVLTRITLDEVALSSLEKQGYSPESVPPEGVKVLLRNNANLSTGGTATDVTDQVHPDIAASAVIAAQMVGLDICGIDLICQDIGKPLANNGAIVEVNAAPGLRMHLSPSFGRARPVGKAIVDALFHDADEGRIPIVAVTGTNGKTTTVRLIAHMLRQQWQCVGMTNSDGIYIGERRIESGDCSGPRSARNVLFHPDVDAAVFETARGGILREGLAFDGCDVAVVTNLGMGDHLGLNNIATVKELAHVKQLIVQNVRPGGVAVLNAADPLVAGMASQCPGEVVFFGPGAEHPRIKRHLSHGGTSVYRQGGRIVHGERGIESHYALDAIALTCNGLIEFQVQNAMAAIAAAHALGLNSEAIRSALASFVCDARTVPGRFNVFDFDGATIIADYGHNVDAIKALVEAVENIPARRRSIVISAAGDRRDSDIRLQTQILGEVFDSVILYEDQSLRGRNPGELFAVLRSGLDGAGRTRRIQEVRGEMSAIDIALRQLRKGELCVILIDQVDLALDYIQRKIQEAAKRRRAAAKARGAIAAAVLRHPETNP